MNQSLYLAYRYLSFHKVRTAVLVASIGIVTFLPNGLQRLIVESEEQLMARAASTPLIVGAKGSSTDLVINTLYFQQEKIENIPVSTAERLASTKLGYSIPIFCAFRARGYPIVSTSMDYLQFRNLTIKEGRNMMYVGDCVVGARAAEELELSPGDSLISSPENFFDLAGVYPLKMVVAGILSPTDTPDDKAVFTDLKTGWVILGLGHGHQDLAKTSDQSVILAQSDSVVTANAKLYMYNQVTGENLERFHFHGDVRTYPITSVLFVPDDVKSEAILRGRFEAKELPHQAVVPSHVVANLLQSIFRIKEIFNTVFVLVGLATLLILGLIVTLSLRLRKGEILTMFTIGSSRGKMAEILGFELLIIVCCSVLFALALYIVTGFFVEEFITYYVL